jgi:hypothetical protein
MASSKTHKRANAMGGSEIGQKKGKMIIILPILSWAPCCMLSCDATGMSPPLHHKTDSLVSVEQYIESDVPFYDYTVAHKTLMASCQEILAMVFSTWNMEDVDYEQCKDGITNKRIYARLPHS